MKYSINKDIGRWRVLNGEAVIINVETSFYYSLNETGTFIWNLLLERERNIEEVVKEVSLHYQEKEQGVRPDVENVLNDLAKENLVKTGK